MWQFMGLANPVLDRCWDADETVAGGFKADDLGAIACTASRDPRRLADRAFEQLTQNAHGQYEDLIRALTPALGQEGLERLKQRMVEYSNTPVADLPQAHRPRIHRRYAGTALEDTVAENTRLRSARSALQDTTARRGPPWRPPPCTPRTTIRTAAPGTEAGPGLHSHSGQRSAMICISAHPNTALVRL